MPYKLGSNVHGLVHCACNCNIASQRIPTALRCRQQRRSIFSLFFVDHATRPLKRRSIFFYVDCAATRVPVYLFTNAQYDPITMQV